ncbi:cyclin-dependent kinase 4 inhibitor B-like [Hyla sarda]|uniref:cyclin-dependent kinase 4 inhibitor B-like n=1 Tax=Hyla sarda TaxID=327740 RepID=UPI0024C37BDA|nr:cyclin-dependent kinase 4 inhibitor B-like [Hyla sarda]
MDVEALSEAAARGDLVTARGLLLEGTDPNEVNRHGRTAIQVMKMSNAKMAQLLLDHSANPNVPDPVTGRFPAHDAARQGLLDTLIVLLKGKAHIHIPDKQGHLPMDMAPNYIVTYLQSWGILSESKKLVLQDTMEPMIRLNNFG